MRLWHKDLIPFLPRQQLLGQWRECCAIARNIEKKGTPNHVLVNKIMDYPASHFNRYAHMVFAEMQKRGYKADWESFTGKGMCSCIADEQEIFKNWHTGRYLRQCLSNLQEKADCGAVPEEEWERITDEWPWFE